MIFFAIPSYLILPTALQNELNKFNVGGMASSMNNQIFTQLGFPPLDTLEPAVKYLSIGMLVAGIAVLILGILLKSIPKQVTLNLNLEGDRKSPPPEEAAVKAIELLQERLAKGEITSSQYQNLKRLMEEKR